MMLKLESPEFIEKAKHIKLVIFDVDGVLTDGRIYVDDHGFEMKAFHVLDGIGTQWLQQSGFEVAIISGRYADGVKHRLEKLGIQHIFLGVENKKAVFESLLSELKLTPIQTAYMGDDLPDLPLLKSVGLGVTVPNAVQEVLNQTSFVTQKKGGKGAVRELCEALLKSQAKWETFLLKYR